MSGPTATQPAPRRPRGPWPTSTTPPWAGRRHPLHPLPPPALLQVRRGGPGERPLGGAPPPALLPGPPPAGGLLGGRQPAPPKSPPADPRRKIYWFKGRGSARRRTVVERLASSAQR